MHRLNAIRRAMRANAIPLGISFIAIAFGAVSEADYRDQVASTAARMAMAQKPALMSR